jgi:hypothetical protein
MRPEGRRLVVAVEELLQEARWLDLSRPEGRFRLGEIAEALRRKLPAATDLFDRLAIDLEVDRDTITEAWFVASAFPSATRRLGLPWSSYQILRFHPERHELVDRAASAGWDQARIQQELSARLAAHHPSPPDQSALASIPGAGIELRCRSGGSRGWSPHPPCLQFVR